MSQAESEQDYINRVQKVYPGLRVWVSVSVTEKHELAIAVFDRAISDEPIYLFWGEPHLMHLLADVMYREQVDGFTIPGFDREQYEHTQETREFPPGFIRGLGLSRNGAAET